MGVWVCVGVGVCVRIRMVSTDEILHLYKKHDSYYYYISKINNRYSHRFRNCFHLYSSVLVSKEFVKNLSEGYILSFACCVD